MSETKFTKGKLIIELDKDRAHIISSFDGNNKAICSITTYGSSNNSIREANAHLIAAAKKFFNEEFFG